MAPRGDDVDSVAGSAVMYKVAANKMVEALNLVGGASLGNQEASPIASVLSSPQVSISSSSKMTITRIGGDPDLNGPCEIFESIASIIAASGWFQRQQPMLRLVREMMREWRRMAWRANLRVVLRERATKLHVDVSFLEDLYSNRFRYSLNQQLQDAGLGTNTSEALRKLPEHCVMGERAASDGGTPILTVMAGAI